jgi:hypothetical protein
VQASFIGDLARSQSCRDDEIKLMRIGRRVKVDLGKGELRRAPSSLACAKIEASPRHRSNVEARKRHQHLIWWNMYNPVPLLCRHHPARVENARISGTSTTTTVLCTCCLPSPGPSQATKSPVCHAVHRKPCLPSSR